MLLSRHLLVVLSVLSLFACKQKPAEENVSANKPAADSSLSNAAASEKAANPYASVDVSPMDMSYFPVDYPKLKMAKLNPSSIVPVIRVIYSRPHLGRRHFHDILKYNEPWRLGANESTEIEFFKPVTIQGKKVQSGRYIIYCIPYADKWTVVLNSNIDTWGLKQDSTKDIQRFDAAVLHDNPPLEYFTMVFEKNAAGADLVMAWDDVVARLPISF